MDMEVEENIIRVTQECIDQVAKMFEHQLNIIGGNTVQLFYDVSNFKKNQKAKQSFILSNDNFLYSLAKDHFGAIEYYNQKIDQNTRNIDILFQDYNKAKQFKEVIKKYYPQYKIHDKMVVSGEICFDMKTLQDVINAKNQTINAFCGSFQIDIPASTSRDPIRVHHLNQTSFCSLSK